MTQSFLDNRLKQSVLIITFLKRSSKPQGEFRRMICTKNDKVLSNVDGRMILGFRPPHGSIDFDIKAKNLCVVWDILKRDYRLVPAESVTIVQSIPPAKWWKFYDESIKTMSQANKEKFMYKP